MERKWIIRLIQPAIEGIRTRHDGRWLVECNVNGYEQNDLAKLVTSTSDLSEAMVFDSAAAALLYWGRQSTLVPERWDGKPNRPLTAYTITVDPVVVGDPEAPV